MSLQIPYKMSSVYKNEKKKLFTVVSMFAGCGGSSTGYRLAGGDILGINEFIPEAITTYKKNYPNTFIFPGDIRELTGEMICNGLGIKPGELDILDGSPPCSAFSMNGLREKGWGKIKQYSDTKQRVDDLFFEFIRILKDIQPRVFICENVQGLTVGSAKYILGKKRKKGLGLVKENTIMSEFRNCGYDVNCKILNSAHYGVPQTRKRLIIIGVRNDLKKSPVFPKTKTKQVTVGDALKKLPIVNKKEKEAMYKLIEEKQYAWFKLLKNIPKNPRRILQGSSYHTSGSYFNLCRLSNTLPCPTLCATGAKEHSAGPCHPTEDRKLTISELKRIQGFPDDFILTGTFDQQGERLGRSVPPLMMSSVASTIYEEILK